MPTPVVRDRQRALYGGVACLVAGSWLLHQAYEARGRTRPWFARFLPGG